MRVHQIHLIMVSVLVFTGFCGSSAVAFGAAIPNDKAVRAIIGEASGEGYRGMLAVAAALRNRGTLRGVYGIRSPHVGREPKWVWDLARKAWSESEHVDPTHGATHWESTDYKVPDWSHDMRVTYRYKKHVFYKSRR